MLTVAALYHFAPFAAYAEARAPLLQVSTSLGVKGTLLLAPEGLNGTIAGTPDAINTVLDYLRALPGFADLSHKLSPAESMPFRRMKVRLKKEIVTMGVPGIDPNQLVGTYVAPQDWNALMAAPDVVVIDTRNDFEVAMGSFEGALNPHMASFREFPGWLDSQHSVLSGKRLAMFCTGGIRCEKATAYARSKGYGEVYHLKGGILKYLEDQPVSDSKWHGHCFVFDERVGLGHGLEILSAPKAE